MHQSIRSRGNGFQSTSGPKHMICCMPSCATATSCSEVHESLTTLLTRASSGLWTGQLVVWCEYYRQDTTTSISSDHGRLSILKMLTSRRSLFCLFFLLFKQKKPASFLDFQAAYQLTWHKRLLQVATKMSYLLRGKTKRKVHKSLALTRWIKKEIFDEKYFLRYFKFFTFWKTHDVYFRSTGNAFRKFCRKKKASRVHFVKKLDPLV